MANKLSKKYDITIFTIYAKGELEKELNSNITLKSLYPVSYQELSTFEQKVKIPLKILLEKNKIYKNNINKNYEAEIAFLEGPITRLFSCKNENTKKIAWIHNDIGQVFGTGLKAKIKKILDKNTYKKFKNLVFVSKENLNNFKKIYPNLSNKKQVIYNYIDREKIIQKSNKEQQLPFKKEEINFLTVARLVPQKAIDRIIEVHSKLIKEGFMHYFYVIGDGPERINLEQKIKEQKVEKTFILLGQKENPYPYIKYSDYFCLLSQFEGYGMVIEEAKILNKYIILTNTAAREAVKNYTKSKIVENTDEGIYEGLKELIQNYKDYKNLTVENTNYNNENVLKEIEELIGE